MSLFLILWPLCGQRRRGYCIIGHATASTVDADVMLSMTSAVARHCISPRCWCRGVHPPPRGGAVVVEVRAPQRVAGACVGGVGVYAGGVEVVVARGGVVGVWGSARLCSTTSAMLGVGP